MKDYNAQTIILKDANGNYLIPYTEKQDRLSTAQLSAVDSGITSDKVNTYDNSLAEIAKKQDKLSETQLNVLDSGITGDKVSAYDTHLSNTDVHITQEERTNLNNLGELAYKDKIVGSDITGTLAQGKIAGLTTALDDKQDKLTAGQNITIAEDGTISAANNISIIEWANVTNKPNFANVATSANYYDLNNRPNSLSSIQTLSYVNLTSFNNDLKTFANTVTFTTGAELPTNSTLTVKGDLFAGGHTDFTGEVDFSKATVSGLSSASIDDTASSTSTVYSSSKVDELLSNVEPVTSYNDLTDKPETLSAIQSLEEVNLSSFNNDLTFATIDDSTVSENTTYSSTKIQELLSSIEPGGGGGSGEATGASVPELHWYKRNTGNVLNTGIILDGINIKLVEVYRNGLILEPNSATEVNDYSIASNNITFTSELESSDKILVKIYK